MKSREEGATEGNKGAKGRARTNGHGIFVVF